MIEARHLRVLRAVAATGSFSAAGRELGCTQPAVSQQMKALEASVGTPLLIRSGREMRLTQAGEALVRHAAGILSGLTAAEEEVAAIAGLRAGRVRLVSFPSGSSTLVPTALAALRAAHPGTRVSLEEAEPPQSVRLLREGDCDIALAFRYERATPGGAHRRGSGPLGFDRVGSGQVRPGGLGPGDSGDDEWADLVVRPLLKDRLVALVPERHRLARTGSSDTVAIGDLAAEPWIAGCPPLPRTAGAGVRECGLHAPHRLRDRRLSGGGRPGRSRSGRRRPAPARDRLRAPPRRPGADAGTGGAAGDRRSHPARPGPRTGGDGHPGAAGARRGPLMTSSIQGSRS
ncbi:DNA-binding transcriptional LysR family regulator [Streptomyces achromogenes]|uniref:DNA-binding transcriptional LysR family regulator n=1 Tax=Streptomyces achromogenes TaxID=67255 RepID=A0ABU0Q526_STRAH|nr:DNA-binding transcriptional LysR family regulator [Streptomyces achromogenes]